MPAAFPSLRGIIRMDKARSAEASFVLPSPRQGYGYPEAAGRDRPTVWEATFRYQTSDAQTFMLWFRNTINHGADEFTMPIRTEAGLVTQLVRFLPDTLLDGRDIGGDVWEYKARIAARAMV